MSTPSERQQLIHQLIGLRSIIDGQRALVDGILRQLGIDTDFEELPPELTGGCPHEHAYETTAMGDDARTFTCPDCGLGWSTAFEDASGAAKGGDDAP